VTWSNSPVIVTFGAGACANPGGASIARMTKANSALTRNLRMTVSSQAVVNSTRSVDETRVDITSSYTPSEHGRHAVVTR